MRKFLKNFVYAARGIRAVWIEELNFKVQIFIAVAAVLVMFFLRFSFIEIVLIVFVIVFVLVIESINTAIEDLCNKVEPRMDPAIGKIKDIMAGAVFMGTIGAIAIGILVLLQHFYGW